MRMTVSRALVAASMVLAIGGQARAADDFYKGKTINVIIGYSAGGTYDATARLLSRYMPKHIPGNPTYDSAESARFG